MMSVCNRALPHQNPLGWVALCLFVSCVLAPLRSWSQDQTTAHDLSIDFDREIVPLLIDQCLDCHSGDSPEGDLDLSVRSQVLSADHGPIIAGDLENSSLWQRVANNEMPPKQELSADEKALLRRWIESGANWGEDPIDPRSRTTKRRAGLDWWAFQPLAASALPTVDTSHRINNAIDVFVLDRLEQIGLAPSPPADARVLARRLFFDLTGLPPSPEQIHNFEQDFAADRDQAVESLVDELLASKHFGERWARHWLDVVRFGESQGFERDKIREDSWHYRDWVIQAMNEDLPYDEFVRLQIAGDIVRSDHPEGVIATGFLVAGAWDEVGQKQQSASMRAVVRQDEMEDYLGTIGQSFLGLTVNCARCHDHKFDPISQREYYQLAAALSGVHHGSRSVQSDGKSISVYAVSPSGVEATFVLHRGNPAAPGAQVSPAGLEAIGKQMVDFGLQDHAPDADRRRKLADWIANSNNVLFARVIVNRLWHYHFGRGIVSTTNDFGFGGDRPSHPELLDWLARQLIENEFRLKPIHRLIVSSATYQQSSLHREDAFRADADNRLLWRKSPHRLEAEALRDSVLAVAGQLNRQYGGAPYRDFETTTNNSQFYSMVDRDHPDVYRRTIYRTWIRSGRSPLLDAFDCPDPSATAPQRAVTTTPIQSLTMMNNSFMLRMADRFAERVQREVGDDVGQQIDRVFSLAYGRKPDATNDLMKFVDEFGLSKLCRVVFNSNEFIHVD